MRRSKTLAMLLQFWRSSLESESEYQLNLVLECLSVLGNLAGSLFVLSLLFSGQSTLGGWTWNEALIVLGLYTLLDGFTSCLLQPNLSKIVNHVQQGTLDFVLLKPVDSQLWLSLRCFSPLGRSRFAGWLRPGGPGLTRNPPSVLALGWTLAGQWCCDSLQPLVLTRSPLDLVREGLECH